MSKIIGGVDPGKRNLGAAWIDEKKSRALIQVTDLAIWDGYLHTLERKDYAKSIRNWAAANAERYKRTSHVFIEEAVAPKNVDLKVITAMIEATLGTMFPDMIVELVRPQDMREQFNTSDPDYNERKRLSVEMFSKFISPNDFERAQTRFRKRSKLLPDGMEAFLYGIYGKDRRYEATLVPEAKATPATNGCIDMSFEFDSNTQKQLHRSTKKKSVKKSKKPKTTKPKTAKSAPTKKRSSDDAKLLDYYSNLTTKRMF